MTILLKVANLYVRDVLPYRWVGHKVPPQAVPLMTLHRVNRFSPFHGSRLFTFADVAQLAEQLICNQQVNGSSPFIGF